MIVIGSPESEVIVEDDREGNLLIFYGFFYIGSLPLEGEFWSMCSYDDESLISVFLIPVDEIWTSTLTVDTSECPEVYYDDFALQRVHREGR